MSVDRRALVEAMREAPEDGSLRLVYADWLEENGGRDRAEYIRLCHEGLGLSAGTRRAAEVSRRKGELWRKHGKRWSKGLPGSVAGPMRASGVLGKVDTNVSTFLRAAEVIAGEPLCRADIKANAKNIAQLAACPALAGVRELTLSNSRLNEAGVKALAESPHLAGLRVLRLAACNIDARGAKHLAGSASLANLTTLDLGFYNRHEHDVNNTFWREVGRGRRGWPHPNRIGDEGLEVLAASPHLGRLETLLVAGNRITAAGVSHLARAKGLKKLHRLDLSENAIGAEGVRELVAAPLMKRLTLLELRGCRAGPVGVAALAGSPAAKLKLLDLSGATWTAPRLDDDSARALAESPHLSGLEHLVLVCNDLGPRGAEALARTKALASLRTLVLTNNELGEGSAAFASSDLLRRLTELDLSATGMGAAAAMAFATSTKAGEQLTLNLSVNGIGREAARALRKRFGDRVEV